MPAMEGLRVERDRSTQVLRIELPEDPTARRSRRASARSRTRGPTATSSSPGHDTTYDHHAGLGLLTPADVHHGLAEQRVAARATVLATAYTTHPERFSAGLPHPPARPVKVWINPPKARATEEARGFAATRGGVILAAVSLTTPDPGSYFRGLRSRPLPARLLGELRHEVSPLPD
jgi:hypothetical protein